MNMYFLERNVINNYVINICDFVDKVVHKDL